MYSVEKRKYLTENNKTKKEVNHYFMPSPENREMEALLFEQKKIKTESGKNAQYYPWKK